jgi:hypothetical protein
MNAKIFNQYNMDDNTIGVYIFLVHMDDNKIFQLEIQDSGVSVFFFFFFFPIFYFTSLNWIIFAKIS